jgi:hypothetical protein
MHKIKKGNFKELISIKFFKKENLRSVNNKVSDKKKRRHRIKLNKNNFKLEFKLNLSSIKPIKKNIVEKEKKIRKSKLLK